ncbi:MAG TPA: glycosyltransferase [Gemmatimonadaceae bacterium]|nr:glycosyltransferase [Gemmatimonadaceae bacterium]
MRVLVLTHNYPRRSGDYAGAFVARLTAAVAGAGHEVHVVAPHAPGTAVEEVADGVRVHRFRYAPEALERVAYRGDLHEAGWRSPLRALGVPLFVLGFRAAAARVARKIGAPDVVHAHWWFPSGWAARPLRVPYVLTCHGSDVRLLDLGGPVRALGSGVLRGAARLTAVSAFLARDVGRAIPALAGAVDVLRMPVDVGRFRAARDAPRDAVPRILFVGNLIPSKGVDVLVEAFGRLRGRGVRCTLRVVGTGPLEGPLRRRVEALGLASAVSWAGVVSHDAIADEYGRSTVAVLPSRGDREGLGLTLVEALLSGCAVVGTPAGGIPEVVEDGVTGLLARDGDPDDLARAIEQLLVDAGFRERLAAAGRARAEREFDPDTCARRFLALYDDAARAKRTGSTVVAPTPGP